MKTRKLPIEDLPIDAPPGPSTPQVQAGTPDTDYQDRKTPVVDANGPSVDSREAIEHFPQGMLINGRYQVEAVLGEGGMGIVYKVADQLHPGRPVALKTIRASTIDQAQLGLFKAEFKVMTQLRHPNVAAVYDFEPTRAARISIHMEYVAGCNLWQATTGIGWEKVVDLVVQVCRALSYVHSRHIVHYDIKPANVMVTASGQVKVLDFGVAGGRLDAGERNVRGTPHYMAPELAESKAVVDYRVDLYALGIMLYQLLYRRLPFNAPTLMQLLMKHSFDELDFQDDAGRYPSWLEDVITKLCAKGPHDRYRTANTVVEAINKGGNLAYELETQETKESYILSSRFVGREEELEELRQFIEQRLHGPVDMGVKATSMFVGGQSGVGKSRLLLELRCWAQLAGLAFIEASCYEGAASEHGPLITALKSIVRLAQACGGHELVQRFTPALMKLAPELGCSGPDDLVSVAGSEEVQRLAIFDQLSEFIVMVAELAPLVIYFNDLQWARQGTTKLLTGLSWRIAQKERSGEKVRVALLGSYRTDEVRDRPAQELLAALQERGELRQLHLDPLGPEHVRQMLTSILGVEGLPEEFLEKVTVETAGNPYFAQEVMRVLVENGTVFLEHGQWAANTSVGELSIPSIDEVFLRRAIMLDENPRHVLTVMAVSGQPVAPEVIEVVTRLSSDELHQALLVLIQRQMAVRLSGDPALYQIAHDRMRQALYGSLGAAAKQIHHSIGLALEQVYQQDIQAHLFELALHFGRSDDRTKALAHNLAGVERAKLEHANELGIGFCRKVIELWQEDTSVTADDRQRLKEHLADFYYMVGRYTESERCYDEILQGTREKLQLARITRKIGDIQAAKGELLRSIDLLWEALGVLGHHRPRSKPAFYLAIFNAAIKHLFNRYWPWKRTRASSLLEARGEVYRVLARAYFLNNPMGLVLAVLRGSNSVEHLGENPLLSEMYDEVAILYSTLGFHKSALEYSQKALHIAERLDSPFYIAVNFSWTGVVYLGMGDWEKAIDLLQKSRDMLLKYGDIFCLSAAYVNLCFALSYQGAFKEVLKAATEGFEAIERTGAFAFREGLSGAIHYSRAMLGYDSQETALRSMSENMACLSQTCTHICLCTSQCRAGDLSLAAQDGGSASYFLIAARQEREENRLPNDYFLHIYPLLALTYLEKIQYGMTLSEQERKQTMKMARKCIRVGFRGARRHRIICSLTARRRAVPMAEQ